MGDDPPMETEARRRVEAADRRRMVVAAGHRGDLETVQAARSDPDPFVRAACLGALERMDSLTVADLIDALVDRDPTVRRRAAMLAGRARGTGSRSALPARLAECLRDEDPLVTEAAAWALGEKRQPAHVAALADTATGHDDPRCREAAIAALGAIGHPDGLRAVMAGLEDRPAVRRRAVVALAGFDDPEVERCLEKCLEDPDWQVRQAAEILLER